MLNYLKTMTNAQKAQIIAIVNALLGALVAFHVVLTDAQIGSIDLIVNALFGLFVGVTYQHSRLRKKTQ